MTSYQPPGTSVRADIIDLADMLWPILVKVAARPITARNANISYSDLVGQLTGRWQGLHHRHPLLNSALGYLVARCRAAGLPAISSVVVNYAKKHPGNAYFLVAHAEAGDDPVLRQVAWAKECTAAHATKYPATVP